MGAISLMLLLGVVFSKTLSMNRTNDSNFQEISGDFEIQIPTENDLKLLSSPQTFWKKLTSGPYDHDIMPELIDKKPMVVNVSIYITRLHSISETTMDYGIDIYYREQWEDQRLKFDGEMYGTDDFSAPSKTIAVLWTPDSYFPNSRSTVDSDTESPTHRTHLRLYSNGTVWYSRRLSLRGDCPMDLSFYPFDQQACFLYLASYGLTSQQLLYKWIAHSPITFDSNVRLPEFTVHGYKYTSSIEKYSNGQYSTLKLCFVLKRSAGFCLLQFVFPAAAVVVSSWVALWLDEETQFNDVIAVIISLIFLSYSQNSVLPKVSYIKLMDVYLATCFLFVFFSLAKLVLLKWVRKSWEKQQMINGTTTTFMEKWNKASAFKKRQISTNSENGNDGWLRCVKGFHIVTQLLLPALFALFFCTVFLILPHIKVKPNELCNDIN